MDASIVSGVAQPNLGRVHRARPWAALALLLPGALCLLVLFFFPIASLIWLSVSAGSHLTLANYATFFTTAGYVKSLLVTLYLSAIVAVVCALLGYPLAYRISRLRPRVANLLMLLVLVPFWTSVLIRGFAWDVLLQQGGPLQRALAALGLVPASADLAHSTVGLIVGMSQVMLPYMVFPIVAALQSIDSALETASRSLGGNGWQTFRRVTLPLSLPGVLAGSLLVFLITVGFYVLPELLGSPGDMMLSQVIEVQVDQVLNWGLASAMAVVLVAVTLAVFALYARIFGLDRLAGSR